MASVRELAKKIDDIPSRAFVYEVDLDNLEITCTECNIYKDADYEFYHDKKEFKYKVRHPKFTDNIDITRTNDGFIKDVDDYFGVLTKSDYALSELLSDSGDCEFGHYIFYLFEDNDEVAFEIVQHVVDGVNNVLSVLPKDSRLYNRWLCLVKQYIMTDLEIKKYLLLD